MEGSFRLPGFEPSKEEVVWCRPALLRFKWANRSPGDLINADSDAVGLGRNLRVCVSRNFYVTLVLLVLGTHLNIKGLEQ